MHENFKIDSTVYEGSTNLRAAVFVALTLTLALYT